jgi:molybdopterin adenylyltransferase
MNAVLKIGLVSISDRASNGVYQDLGIPALKDWLSTAIATPFEMVERLIADEQPFIETTLLELCDTLHCDLILTTGGTGPARRDVTPEATMAVATKPMPGFGEQMRQIGLAFVPTAILSRQVAVIREIRDHAALIINLPGQPKAIGQTLGGLKNIDANHNVSGIFAAVPYCIDLIGGPYISTHETVCKVFRPQSAKPLSTSPS